jgi:antitoxin VapB
METAKLFQNGRSQAVRLPRDFRLPGDEVYIKKVGDLIMLIPRKSRMKLMFEGIDEFIPDFEIDRSQKQEIRAKL